MKSTWTGLAVWNTDGFEEAEEVDVQAENHREAKELITRELTEGYQGGWTLKSIVKRTGGVSVQTWK
jgi:hypothetical protein